jgi:hypothetical protein
MLQFGATRSLMGHLLAALPLTASLDQAATDVQQAGEQLERPRADLEALLLAQSVHAVWQTDDGFADNAGAEYA